MAEQPTDDPIIEPSDTVIPERITFEPPIIASPPVTLITPVEPAKPPPDIRAKYDSFKPIPQTGRGPVGNYYAEIHWPSFERWRLVRFSTPMDGNCLFHAIANGFFAPYHTETLKGKRMNRHQIVTQFRRELSLKLAVKISEDEAAPTHYDILNRGNTKAFAEAVPEFALEYMQAQLDSPNHIGYGYMEFIGNALNKDIYILEATRKHIYATEELPLTIKGDRKSIILYYMEGHYELVGIQRPDGPFDTHFSPDHSFIRFLNQLVRQRVEEQTSPVTV
jgi:hypothetical protein